MPRKGMISFFKITGPILVLALIGLGGFWGIKSGWSFLEDRPAKKYYGEETLVQRGFVPLGQWGKRETKHREKSRGDIVISEGTRIINDTEFLHSGSITIEGGARLAFRDSVLEMTPGNAPAFPAGRLRADIFVKDKAELIFENSTLKPHADDPANLYVHLEDEARFIFNNSSGLHMLIAGGNSRILINNSIWAYSMPNFRGGGVQIGESAMADIRDSTIGGLIVELPQQARAEIKDFKPGIFGELDFKKDYGLKYAGFNIVLENTEILGDYLEGGNERGLAIFTPAEVQGLRVVNSELNKLVIENSGEKVKFSNLALQSPQDWRYNNINLENSKVMAQWGFSLRDGSGEFADSEGLWFSIKGDVKLRVDNSEMNEPLIWSNSQVTREFPIDIFILNPGPVPARSAAISVFDKNDNALGKYDTNRDGRAYFSISFNDNNYRDKFYIKVSKFDKEARHEINFLTPTPIKLILK